MLNKAIHKTTLDEQFCQGYSKKIPQYDARVSTVRLNISSDDTSYGT